MSDVLHALRTATAPIHERLHHHPLLMPLLEATLTHTAYVHVLQAFYPFQQVMEAIPGYDRGPGLGAYRPLPRSSLLAHDLRVLRAPPLSLMRPPFALDFPGGRSTQEDVLWGVLYVMEGAQLGGQQIAKNVQKTLGLTKETGCAFFTGHGRATGGRWKLFLGALAECRGDPQHISQSARETFLFLEKWLNMVQGHLNKESIKTQPVAQIS